ncbi:hypothetical protein Tco_0610926 [Tanacetum coccineum]
MQLTNTHNSFVPLLSFSDMVHLQTKYWGFTWELERTSSSFKTTGLLQPWQTLCKIFSKCLTTRVTRWDQPLLQIMQMMYCFVNNIYVDYVKLLWEGLYCSLHHPTSSIPYPRFTKIIISHYMTIFPDIHDIPAWMITKEIEAYGALSYVMPEVFGIRCSSGLGDLHVLPHSSSAIVVKASYSNINVALVDEHLASEEIEKMVEGPENVVDDSSIPRNDESNIPGTRIEPKSNKESSEVGGFLKIGVKDEDEEITDEVYELKRRERKGRLYGGGLGNSPIPHQLASPRIHTNLVFRIPRKTLGIDGYHTTSLSSSPIQILVYVAEGLILERKKAKEETERLIAKAILAGTWKYSGLKFQHKFGNAIAIVFISQVDASVRSYMSGHILHVHPAQSQTSSVLDQQYQLLKFLKEIRIPTKTACRTPVVLAPRDQDDLMMILFMRGIKCKQTKTSEYEDYVSGESSSDDDDIPTLKESHKTIMEKWVNKCVRKFNPYARYGVEHWKNPHAKIFYIRKQKEPGKPKEEIIARRANKYLVSITEPDYKNLNKNDIEDIYLLIMNGKVPDYADTGFLWSLSVCIRQYSDHGKVDA